MKNIKLKSLLKEEVDYVDYFNNTKFKLGTNFLPWYTKKYGLDVRYKDPEKWAGKPVKIYKVRPVDKSIQISWAVRYTTFNDKGLTWSIMIPFKDVFQHKLLDKI